MAAAADVRQELARLADPGRTEALSRYLQMVPGGYGEGDRAIGVPVPDQRRVAGRYWRDLSLTDTAALLASGVHEERLTALLILVRKFDKGDDDERGRIVRLLRDQHALVHKAVGWMLREVGNRDRAAEEEFLARTYREMPRVMLRYAIEKFEPERRTAYLAGLI